MLYILFSKDLPAAADVYTVSSTLGTNQPLSSGIANGEVALMTSAIPIKSPQDIFKTNKSPKEQNISAQSMAGIVTSLAPTDNIFQPLQVEPTDTEAAVTSQALSGKTIAQVPDKQFNAEAVTSLAPSDKTIPPVPDKQINAEAVTSLASASNTFPPLQVGNTEAKDAVTSQALLGKIIPLVPVKEIKAEAVTPLAPSDKTVPPVPDKHINAEAVTPLAPSDKTVPPVPDKHIIAKALTSLAPVNNMFWSQQVEHTDTEAAVTSRAPVDKISLPPQIKLIAKEAVTVSLAPDDKTRSPISLKLKLTDTEFELTSAGNGFTDYTVTSEAQALSKSVDGEGILGKKYKPAVERGFDVFEDHPTDASAQVIAADSTRPEAESLSTGSVAAIVICSIIAFVAVVAIVTVFEHQRIR